MDKSNEFRWIKGYYDEGYYTKDHVKVFVVAEWIKAEEYEEITGEPYTA